MIKRTEEKINGFEEAKAMSMTAMTVRFSHHRRRRNGRVSIYLPCSVLLHLESTPVGPLHPFREWIIEYRFPVAAIESLHAWTTTRLFRRRKNLLRMRLRAEGC